MACERWREMLSAQLDGEDDPAGRPLADEHLAGCAGCREWLDRAAAVNRLTRTALPVAPDRTADILAALAADAGPGARRPDTVRAGGGRGEAGERMPAAAVPGGSVAGGAWRRVRGRASAAAVPGGSVAGGMWRRVRGWVRAVPGGSVAGGVWRRVTASVPVAVMLYVALAVVGAVQLIAGLGQVGDGIGGSHEHTGLAASSGHLWHESAAWNVAVGAGYLFIALRRSRPSGLMPMLTAFVGMLLLLSVNDLTGGRVDSARLVSHGFVIAGYLLIVALGRVPGGFAAPPGARAEAGSGWRARFGDEEGRAADVAFRPGLRLVPRGPTTAEHDRRRAA